MLARRLIPIPPVMTLTEGIETTRMKSVTALTGDRRFELSSHANVWGRQGLMARTAWQSLE